MKSLKKYSKIGLISLFIGLSSMNFECLNNKSNSENKPGIEQTFKPTELKHEEKIIDKYKVPSVLNGSHLFASAQLIDTKEIIGYSNFNNVLTYSYPNIGMIAVKYDTHDDAIRADMVQKRSWPPGQVNISAWRELNKGKVSNYRGRYFLDNRRPDVTFVQNNYCLMFELDDQKEGALERAIGLADQLITLNDSD